MSNVPSDLEIAQNHSMTHINHMAETLGLSADDIEHYGKYKAKIPLSYINEEKVAKSNLVLVTSINPTPAGEGKTTVSIGLADGLNNIGKKTAVVLREPSLGPVFGMKGGAAGGGYSQVVPMEDINLHFTGDFAAIEKANNLLSALIDNNLQSRTRSLQLDPRMIYWKRVMDMNDRSLRKITIGQGGTANGMPREDGFNITPASEVMAILCLSKDREDLKKRLGNIFVGFTMDRKPVFARDLNAQGAMALLLKDAIKPNLVQTLGKTPAILHGGPFANIAQGTNSIIATKMGLSLRDYVVTEAGFGSDLGAEKFLDIKCPNGDLKPKALVIVATVRALRHHGGAERESYGEVSLERVKKGFANLEKHIENGFKFGITPLVAINHRVGDSEEEIAFVKAACKDMGVDAVVTKGWAHGGKGAEDLAKAVVKAVEADQGAFKPLYDWNLSIPEKIETIAKEIYGASGVDYQSKAKLDLKRLEKLGLDKLPVCIAKTQKSFSEDEKAVGKPTNFRITIREIEFAAGAGFVVPIAGNMLRMPGLPAVPASEQMDIDADGIITGLS